MEWLGKQPPAVDVKTKDGTVRGSWIRDREFQEDVAIFNGIPYAQPPVGKLRWRPPHPVEPWDGVKLTRRYGPEAPQLGMEFMGFLRFAVQKHAFGTVQSKAYIHGARLLRTRLAAAQSEDCLYLNVRTTSRLVLGRGFRELKNEDDENRPPDSIGHIDSTNAVDSAKNMGEEEVALLPVIVYFHGGDHHDGAGGSRPFYAANALPVKGRVVLVTFNYRLGVIGHFTHPELAKEAGDDGRPAVSGNYSVLDQARPQTVSTSDMLHLRDS